MEGRLKDGMDSSAVAVGFGLENGLAAAFDFIRPSSQAAEERAYFVADLRLGREAGIGGDFGADPAPDVLVRVEVGAVGRQANQAEPQVRRAQVRPQRIAAVGRAVIPDDDQWLGDGVPAAAARMLPRSQQNCCPPTP
jgi:hypothetical protein